MLVIVISTVILMAAIVFIYNSLTFRKNAVEQSYGAVHAYMKKRADLIPNLVAVVRAAAEHEKELLQQIVELRTALSDESRPDGQRMLESEELSRLVQRLFIRTEGYPELKSNENFLDLQRQIAEVEDQLSAARRAYNGSVTFYNNGVEMIPFSLIAPLMGLKIKRVYSTSQTESSKP